MSQVSVPVDTSDTRIPEALRPLLDRALHPDPALRYRDGNELTEALTRVGGLPCSAIDIPQAAMRSYHPAAAAVPAFGSGARRSGRAFLLLALGVTAGAVVSAVLLATSNLIPSASSADRTATRSSASPVSRTGTPAAKGAGSGSTATARRVPSAPRRPHRLRRPPRLLRRSTRRASHTPTTCPGRWGPA